MNQIDVSRANSLAVVLRWPTSRAREWTESFLESVRADKNILAVVAIGSAVRPAVKSVDLDLIVISVDKFEVAPRPPIEIDLRTYRASELDKLVGDGADLAGWTLMYGKVLFQRNSYWDDLVSSWEGRIPLPSQEVAVARARKAIVRVKEMNCAGDQGAASEIAISYLTHLARAALLRAKQYPKSRPELPAQLREIDEMRLAELMDLAITKRQLSKKDLEDVLQTVDMLDYATAHPA